jgi:hypothetical protein
MNSVRSPWKPLICNYDNFLQMQSFEELKRATAEIGVVNPGWSAHSSVGNQISVTALNIYGVVAAVVAFFPAIFPSGLPAKYFMHARMAVLSRAPMEEQSYALWQICLIILTPLMLASVFAKAQHTPAIPICRL